MKYKLINPQEYEVIEQLLFNRGIYNINHYLNTSDNDIYDPELLDNIEDGVKMLMRHIKNNDEIVVIVDPDVDGFTSSALLINYLNTLFPNYTQSKISYILHSGKQHGLSDLMEYLDKHLEYKLVICPDSSSNDIDCHRRLKEQNKEILVLDHHMSDVISKDACIINNQLCDYPTKSLSGVGIVYKFCCYIDKILEINKANDFLDLVMLGMISDMMSLKDYETKRLIDKGFKNINNEFLKEIIQKQNYSISSNGGLCPFTISFYITPLINAAIRLGTQNEKKILFEAFLDFKSLTLVPSTKRGCKGTYETLSEQAVRNCNNIKNRQTKARDNCLEIIEKKIERENLLDNKIMLIKIKPNDNINKNITGLIANQLMGKYQCPILLLNESIAPNGEKIWEGSARGYTTEGFEDLRGFMRESGLVYLAEGR